MTNKYKYFVANWKMFGDIKMINSINKVIKISKSRKFNKAKIIYCPPYTLLDNFVQKLKKTNMPENPFNLKALRHCLGSMFDDIFNW